MNGTDLQPRQQVDQAKHAPGDIPPGWFHLCLLLRTIELDPGSYHCLRTWGDELTLKLGDMLLELQQRKGLNDVPSMVEVHEAYTFIRHYTQRAKAHRATIAETSEP